MIQLLIFAYILMEKDTIVKEWLEFVETQFFWGSWKNSAILTEKGRGNYEIFASISAIALKILSFKSETIFGL
jgi:hypothetical protein